VKYLDYHSYQWLNNEELRKYNSIWVWCNRCQSKHGIGTNISSNHSDKCQLIPIKCNSNSDHCWKYIGNHYEDIYSISKNNTYIKVNVDNIAHIKHLLIDNWKKWVIIGEDSLYRCIACKKEKKETYALINGEELKNKLDNLIQEKKEILNLLELFYNLKSN